MLTRRAVLGVLGGLALSSRGLANEWPQRPIRFITPAQPGGSPDTVARIFANALSTRLSQPIAVENRPGADGILAVQALLQATANDEDHTFLVAPATIASVLPALKRKLPFDVATDLQPIAGLAADFLAIAVPASSPFKSIDDVVSTAKRSPNSLNWFAVAGAPYMLMAQWLMNLSLPIVHVPYKGGPDAARDLAEDRIQLVVAPLAVLTPLSEAGRIRLLAVTNPARSNRAPVIPTTTEVGFPDLALEGLIAIFGQKKSAERVRLKLAEVLRAASSEAAVADALGKSGLTARTYDATALSKQLNEQRTRWTVLAEELGLRSD